MLQGCEEITSRISRLPLIEKSITRIVQAYNACMGETDVVYKERKPWLALKPAIAVCLEFSKVAIRGTGTQYIDYFNTDIKGTSSPVVWQGFLSMLQARAFMRDSRFT
jgi:hypothetical protein